MTVVVIGPALIGVAWLLNLPEWEENRDHRSDLHA